jgi:hypothetical protein
VVGVQTQVIRCVATCVVTFAFLVVLGLCVFSGTIIQSQTPNSNRTIHMNESASILIDARVVAAGTLPASAATPSELSSGDTSGTWRFDRGYLRHVDALGVEILTPKDIPDDLQIALFLKDKDGTWFQSDPVAVASPEARTTILFDLRPETGHVRSMNHDAVWNAYYRDHVEQAGLQLTTGRPWQGRVPLGNISPIGGVPEDAAPAFVHLEQCSPEPKAYEQFELQFDVLGVSENPFDSDDVRVDAIFTTPSGREMSIPCFYYQGFGRRLTGDGTERLTPSGRGAWRVRYTPLEGGRHSWKLIAQCGRLQVETNAHTFAVLPAAPRDFVRVSPADPRYLETADGRFFYPVGQNIHAPFDARSAKMLGVPLPPNGGTFAYDTYFQRMAEHGENAVIVWMCNWWVSIEWTDQWKGYYGLNDYNLANAWRIDYLLDAAARHGIYVQLVLDNHGKFSGFVDSEWETNPYNSDLGGPCKKPDDFFARRAAFLNYAKTLRYIVARWGSHPNLLGYELISEMNLVGESRAFKGDITHALWVAKTAHLLDDIDAYRRPVIIQYSNDFHAVDPRVASLKELDILVGDAYKAGGSIVPLMIETAEQNGRFGKPTYSAEFGGNWNGTSPARLRADFHFGLWSNCMTGTAGAPFFWWFDFVDRYNLYREYGALVNYMRAEDRRGIEWTTIRPEIAREGIPVHDVGALALTDGNRADFWVYDTLASEIMPEQEFARPWKDLTLAIPDLRAGNYRLEFWNTWTGQVIEEHTVRAGPEGLTVSVPLFHIDLAGKVRPLRGSQP